MTQHAFGLFVKGATLFAHLFVFFEATKVLDIRYYDRPMGKSLHDLLQARLRKLVQQIVTKLTAPEPCTEREIATKLKGQVTELKAMSIKKNQLQEKIDGVKAQYASLLTDMQDLQSKLAEGQKALHQLSQDYMKAINQTPAPTELAPGSAEPEQIPMLWNLLYTALESRSQRSRRTNSTAC